MPGALGTAALSGIRPLGLTAQIQQNELLSRSMLEAFGDTLPTLVLSRNNYERLEQFMDWAGWITASLAIPYGLVRPMAKRLERGLLKKHGLTLQQQHAQSLLHFPLQWLDHSQLAKRLATFRQWETEGSAESARWLGKTGLNSFKQLSPELLKGVLNLKLGIIYTDLVLLAVKGQGIQWVKNWVTAKLSGKKGFSGIMNYSSEAYREQESKEFEANKKKRFWTSISLGFGAALTFPTFLSGALKAGKHTPLFKHLKGGTRWFNYSNIVFMKKPVLLIHNVFNFVLPTLMACRGPNEFREKAIRLAFYDSFFFLGDDVLSGQIAKLAQRGKRLETSLVKKVHGFPVVKNLEQLAEEVGTHSKAYKLAQRSFWGGLLGASFLLSVSLRLANMAYTKHHVVKEQERLNSVSASIERSPAIPPAKPLRMTRQRPVFAQNGMPAVEIYNSPWPGRNSFINNAPLPAELAPYWQPPHWEVPTNKRLVQA